MSCPPYGNHFWNDSFYLSCGPSVVIYRSISSVCFLPVWLEALVHLRSPSSSKLFSIFWSISHVKSLWRKCVFQFCWSSYQRCGTYHIYRGLMHTRRWISCCPWSSTQNHLVFISCTMQNKVSYFVCRITNCITPRGRAFLHNLEVFQLINNFPPVDSPSSSFLFPIEPHISFCG